MRELAISEDDDAYARLWRPDEDDRTLFVTHLTPESATRYQFDILDLDAGTCVYAKGSGITPPRVVVELLNDADYEVQNLPNITEADPAVRAQHIIKAIQWLGKHGGLDPSDLRRFAYQRAQNVLPVVYGSALIMEVVGPDRYTEYMDDLLTDASRKGRTITGDELRDPRTHDIEFLQTLLINLRKSLPMEEQERVADLAEQRLGLTVDRDKSADSPEMNTWESSTQSESTVQLHEEAVATLEEEGWFDNRDSEL